MEHVTIISQEAITRGLMWPPIVVAGIAICFVIAALIMSIVGKHLHDHAANLLGYATCMIPVLLITMGICTCFFPVETGRYKYEGTLDPDMTIVEFEEFQQQYDNVRFEDGVWKWEDKG